LLCCETLWWCAPAPLSSMYVFFLCSFSFFPLFFPFAVLRDAIMLYHDTVVVSWTKAITVSWTKAITVSWTKAITVSWTKAITDIWCRVARRYHVVSCILLLLLCYINSEMCCKTLPCCILLYPVVPRLHWLGCTSFSSVLLYIFFKFSFFQQTVLLFLSSLPPSLPLSLSLSLSLALSSIHLFLALPPVAARGELVPLLHTGAQA